MVFLITCIAVGPNWNQSEEFGFLLLFTPIIGLVTSFLQKHFFFSKVQNLPNVSRWLIVNFFGWILGGILGLIVRVTDWTSNQPEYTYGIDMPYWTLVGGIIGITQYFLLKKVPGALLLIILTPLAFSFSSQISIMIAFILKLEQATLSGVLSRVIMGVITGFSYATFTGLYLQEVGNSKASLIARWLLIPILSPLLACLLVLLLVIFIILLYIIIRLLFNPSSFTPIIESQILLVASCVALSILSITITQWIFLRNFLKISLTWIFASTLVATLTLTPFYHYFVSTNLTNIFLQTTVIVLPFITFLGIVQGIFFYYYEHFTKNFEEELNRKMLLEKISRFIILLFQNPSSIIRILLWTAINVLAAVLSIWVSINYYNLIYNFTDLDYVISFVFGALILGITIYSIITGFFLQRAYSKKGPLKSLFKNYRP